MTDFILSCSSTADLNKKTYDEKNINVIPMHFILGGKEYADDFSLPSSEFYKAMVDGADTKTSSINTSFYIDYFTKLIKTNKRILHVELSSGLSSSVDNAKNAAKIVGDENKGVKIMVLDSLGASSGFGLIMSKLAALRDEGKSLEEVYSFGEEHRLELHHWFFSTDLTFYIRGGRVSKASGWFGTLLHICPLLNMSNDGKLIPRMKIVGHKKVNRTIVEQMKTFAFGGTEYNDECFISHSDCLEIAEEVKVLVEENFPNLIGKIQIFDIGATIGSHAGPGTVALFFWGDKRTN